MEISQEVRTKIEEQLKDLPTVSKSVLKDIESVSCALMLKYQTVVYLSLYNVIKDESLVSLVAVIRTPKKEEV